jgi:pimeloyl-ACP methyl ester carboxylesterase
MPPCERSIPCSIGRVASIVLLAFLASACAPDAAEDATADAPAALPSPPEDSFVEVNGVRLHYLDHGGEGDVLLFVPGSSMTAQSFNAVAPHFTDRYRVLAVTRRWHGASEKTDLTFDLDTLAADLTAFLDHFTDRPAIVAGWSYAGLELTRLARARPDLVRALVFLDANYDPSAFAGMTPPPAPQIDSVFPSLAAAVDVFRRLLPRVDSALVEQYLQSALYRTEGGVYAWQLPPSSAASEHLGGLMSDWSPEDYVGIDVPVLAFRVEQADAVGRDMLSNGTPPDAVEAVQRWIRDYDDVSKSRALAALVAAIPDARVVVLDEVSHSFVMDDPDVVVELMNGFLDDLERGRRMTPPTRPKTSASPEFKSIVKSAQLGSIRVRAEIDRRLAEIE